MEEETGTSGMKRRRRWRMTEGGGKVRRKRKRWLLEPDCSLQRPILTHTCRPRRSTTDPKQCLAQAGRCCCRSNKGEVWEGGDSRQGGCERIGRTLTLLWCHPSLPPLSHVHPFIPSPINTGSETEWILCMWAEHTSVSGNMSRPVCLIDLRSRGLLSLRPSKDTVDSVCHSINNKQKH